MRKLHLILLTILSFLCLSCGVGRELQTIQVYQKDKDVESLLRSYEAYPKYHSTIEYTLINEINYESYEYGELKKFSNLAEADPEISMFFDSLLVARQARTLDSLSVLNVDEVADFYRMKGQEHDYLHNTLIDTYFSDIPTLDYQSMKILNNAFMDTDLYPLVNRPYVALRDSLLSEIFSVWNPYFSTEEQMLTDIEDVVREECQKYIEDGLKTIMEAVLKKNDRTFLKKLFKKQDIDEYTFEEYVNGVINQTFDPTVIESMVLPRLQEFINTSYHMRYALFNEYFDANCYDGISVDASPLSSTLIWQIGRGDVQRMQNIKDTATMLTVGSIALGFIPGIGALAFVADAADFAYAMGQDKKERKAIQSMSDTIYNDSMASVGEYLSYIFGSISKSRSDSEQMIRSIFIQDF